jgi:hypothetical protein
MPSAASCRDRSSLIVPAVAQADSAQGGTDSVMRGADESVASKRAVFPTRRRNEFVAPEACRPSRLQNDAAARARYRLSQRAQK